MRVDKNNSPYKTTSDAAEILIRLRITTHAKTKTSPFEAHMNKKPNTPFSNLATSC